MKEEHRMVDAYAALAALIDESRAPETSVARRRELAEGPIEAAKAAAVRARLAYVEAITTELAAPLRADRKLQERVRELFAAIVAIADPTIGLSGYTNWEKALLDLFPWPEGAALDEATAAIKARYPALSRPAA